MAKSKLKLDLKAVAMKTAGLAGGGIAAGMLMKHIPAQVPENLRPVLLIVAGAFIPQFIGKKQPLVGFVGDGMIASGANALVRQFMPNLVAGIEDEGSKFLSGVGDPGVFGPTSIADLPVEEDPLYLQNNSVSGYDDEGQLAGLEEEKSYTI